MDFDFRSAYANAKAALDALQKERNDIDEEYRKSRADIDVKISALIQTVDALAPMAGGKPVPIGSILPPMPPPSKPSMTQAIRGLLNAYGSLSPTEVRDHLKTIGFELSTYDNALATIHTVLSRIAEEIVTPDGKRYRLVGSIEKRVQSVQGLEQAERRRRFRKI